MQPAFLSLTEAAKQTGKNTDTIRRLIKKLLAADPNTPDIRQLPIKNGARMYYISMAAHIQKSLHPLMELERNNRASLQPSAAITAVAISHSSFASRTGNRMTNPIALSFAPFS